MSILWSPCVYLEKRNWKLEVEPGNQKLETQSHSQECWYPIMAQETAQPCGPVSTGDCPVIEKMEKRTCALCPEGHEWSQIYFAPSANIAAHENCLRLYSSGLVECEAHDPPNTARNFDVKSVKKEIWRGRRLGRKCSFCNEGGATVGCDLSYCKKSYHYVCAKKDQAIPQVDGDHGTYKVFCPEHPPQQVETTENAESPSMKKKRGRKKCLSPGSLHRPKKMKFSSSKRHMTEAPHGHTDAAVKAPFLKKCQEAGLLTELFEQILEKMDSIHGRFMDETASESDYEGIETLLFDCRLFGDTLRKFQEGDCEVPEMMQQRTCALCPEGHEWSQIYFAPSANIAAHENCLLYSSGLVECEAHDPPNTARNFDVKSVKKEIWRGRRLICSFCSNRGATVGCDLQSCAKNYHLLCAKEDHATLQVDEDHGTYNNYFANDMLQRVQNPPGIRCSCQSSFLKKCQEAGLLTELFERILEKMDSIHGRFMDETASESDYEEMETLLFDSGFFGDTLRKFQEGRHTNTQSTQSRSLTREKRPKFFTQSTLTLV
ncbi:PHD finger protein 11 [Apodemus speciosus]|uniref:PHD finger protein 11 n=1 Tax=Apodemus speciosus TaxID=105296 RepID=A0ABQ0FI97_APOSI